MPVHLVSQIRDRDFTAEQLHFGDLNGDGAPDLLFVQSVYGTREITCLTATTLSGEVLWQVGTPNRENGRIYGDLPAQVYDWDGDGRNEVLYVVQARYVEANPWAGWARERATRYEGDAFMVVLDALTGRERERFPIPAPADDCFLFADLTGRGRRQDLVVKDRYWNMWGVAHDHRVLWHWEGSVGHFPAIADVDGDGCDEVFVGVALIDQDGRVIYAHDPRGSHQDAAWIARLPSGEWRLVYGNHGIHCLTPDGTELWQHPLREAQHVIAGHFRADSAVQFAVLDRGQPVGNGPDRGPATLYLYDVDGNDIWCRPQPPGSWVAGITPLNWQGQGGAEILMYSRGPVDPVAVFDGNGDVVDVMPLPLPTDQCFYALAADVWGDGRDEVVVFGATAAYICANSRPLAIPTLYNETLYPGM